MGRRDAGNELRILFIFIKESHLLSDRNFLFKLEHHVAM